MQYRIFMVMKTKVEFFKLHYHNHYHAKDRFVKKEFTLKSEPWFLFMVIKMSKNRMVIYGNKTRFFHKKKIYGNKNQKSGLLNVIMVMLVTINSHFFPNCAFFTITIMVMTPKFYFLLIFLSDVF